MAGIALLGAATILLSSGALTGFIGFKAVAWLKGASSPAEGVEVAPPPGSPLKWAGIGAVVAGVSYYCYFKSMNTYRYGGANEKGKGKGKD